MTVTMGAGEAPSSCIPMHADPALQIRSAAVVGIDGSVQCLCDVSTVGERPAGCAASTCASIISRPAGTQSDQIVIQLQTAAGERVNDGVNTTVRLGYRSDYPSVSAGASGLFLTAPSPSTPPLIVTQFESFGARKAFPCMDEPALEAPFAVNYILPRDPRLVALANMPLARTYEHPGQPEMIVHQFEQTPPMPTYLVCVVIGQLVRLPSHHPGLTSTSVSVWAVAEHASLLADAVEYSAAALRFMELFTGVEFALPKADLVAVPGFGGAMENWGLLVMDESRFLVNRTTESTQARVASANIVCHEVRGGTYLQHRYSCHMRVCWCCAAQV
jgi:aminopeptidase N